jgi:hypothetical protein
LSLRTPVALFIFNRPDTTARVFAEIAKVKPARLLVVADGPRPDRPGEAALCEAARAAATRVSWNCELTVNFADRNLGCRKRMTTGLDWVFGQCEDAVILEDDCVPDPSFFLFCEELLDRYRTEERVVHIGGTNLMPQAVSCSSSYFFSRHSLVWGWASWRRAWRLYDEALSDWPRLRDNGFLARIFERPEVQAFWRGKLDAVHAREIDTWDYQWAYTCWQQDRLCIWPRTNLISNIGFRPDATHTRDIDSALARLRTAPVTFPLIHPRVHAREIALDDAFERKYHGRPTMTDRIISRLKRSARKLIHSPQSRTLSAL